MKPLYFCLLLSAIVMADDEALEGILDAASSQFTGNFFSEVLSINPEKSIVVSAFSVMTPIALLGLGSTDAAHDELLNAIGLPNDTITKSVFSYADTKLRSIKGVELKAANKIYIPLQYELDDEFAAVSRDVFKSEVTNIDFTKSTATAKEINEWVEAQTNNRIKDLISPDSLDANTRAVLVNALYFKGTWDTQFSKSLTVDKDFHVTKDKVITVPMMNNKANYKYIDSFKLNSKILEMPYLGKETSMVFILPFQMDGINELLENLKDLSVLNEEIKNMYQVEVKVSIPKFKIETTVDLKTVLENMCVTKLFNVGDGNLDKLLKNSKDLYVSSATQKAFIEVNEEGAEAAAANQFTVSYATSVMVPREYYFIAEYPFVFLLKEKNNILFSGIFYG